MSTRDKSCFLLKTKLKALERLHIKQVKLTVISRLSDVDCHVSGQQVHEVGVF